MARHLVVGIAGGSASGKTTLIGALNAALDETATPHLIISVDRYMRRSIENSPTFVFSVTGEPTFNANHPDSIDWELFKRELDERLAALQEPHVVILEGHLLLHHEEIRNRLDLRLFIELDADERALRRLLRDMKGGRGMSDPAHIAAYYLECARVGHAMYIEPTRRYADLILRGDASWERLRPMLLAVITDRFAQVSAASV